MEKITFLTTYTIVAMTYRNKIMRSRGRVTLCLNHSTSTTGSYRQKTGATKSVTNSFNNKAVTPKTTGKSGSVTRLESKNGAGSLSSGGVDGGSAAGGSAAEISGSGAVAGI